MSNKIQVVETVGIVSVVLSLLFVAYQIQQTNQIAIVTTEVEIRNSYGELNESMYSAPQLARLIEKATEPSFTPQEGELTQLRSLAFRFLNVWMAAEIAYNNDMLPTESFEIVLNDIRYLVHEISYMRVMLKEILDNYPGWDGTQVATTIRSEIAN
ncbi:MAG: hypothetical protein ACR2PZ_01520 [Pseudomonadales bacterium]